MTWDQNGPGTYGLVGPLLRLLEPETAHRLAIKALAAGPAPTGPVAPDDPALAVRLWGHTFANPVGLAAGFDKNAEVADAMLARGFGFVEAGTVTRRPQAGNPRPRVFRLGEDGALINRLGFNNQGLDAVAARLERRRQRGQQRGRRRARGREAGFVGVNVGPNRDSRDPAGDCAAMVRALAPLADYVVVNVSSPNTPGLRDLQAEAALRTLLTAVLAARADTAAPDVPILVKIAPDLSRDGLAAVAEAALGAGIDGLVATNTTVARPPTLRSGHREEAGGLSGTPLFAPSTAILAELYRLTAGKLPLIGVGGIASGADAYAKIRAGASLVQLYTALVYQGPRLIARIKRDMLRCLRADGFASLAEAVGSGTG